MLGAQATVAGSPGAQAMATDRPGRLVHRVATATPPRHRAQAPPAVTEHRHADTDFGEADGQDATQTTPDGEELVRILGEKKPQI